MNIKVYEKLPKEAVMIRTEVFIKEQGFNNEKEIIKNGGDAAELLAQVRASRFYEKNGYHSMAEYHNDEGCMHVVMRKELVSTSL